MKDGVITPGWDSVTTAGYRPRDGLRRWTEWGQREFAGLQVRPSDPAAFAGQATRMTFGPAVLSTMTFSPAQAVNCLPDESAPEVDDAIVLSLPEQGRFAYASDGAAAVEVGCGDIYLRDLTRPWSAATTGDSALITLRLPYHAYLDRFGDPAALTGHRFDGRQAEVACVAAILRAAAALLRTAPPEAQRQALSRSVLEALEMLLAGSDLSRLGRTPPAPRAELSLHRQALLHITRHLGDPDLSAGAVARALGVGPRRLQRAFRARGATVQGTILDQRLARAARILADSPGRVGITGLAMTLGFNDMAYFSRAFAARYGLPPSRYALH